MEREIDSGLQQNNGSPKGYGQPRKKLPKSVVVRPQDEQVLGQYPQEDRPPVNTTQPVNSPQPTTWASALGQYAQQNQNTLTPDQRSATAHLTNQPSPSGLYDAFKQSVQNGYTDIQDTKPWQTGQYMDKLQGFNTNGWGSGERGTGTLKNKMGQLFSNYDPGAPNALQAVMADPRFQELTGGKATIVNHPNQDQIDFDGPDGPMAPVDVIGNAVNGSGTNWWWGTDTGAPGPAAPANQIYNQAIPGVEALDQQALLAQMGQAPGQAMEFLQWLMSQQQNGQLMNGGIGSSPVTF